MRVISLVYRCALGRSRDTSVDIVVRPTDMPRDARSIACVIETASGDDGFRPSVGATKRELIGRPGRSVVSWMALIDDHPVGLVTLVASTAGPVRRHSVGWLIVSSHARRRGVGTALALTAMREACDRHARDVWVETRTDWQGAVAFWHAVGFRPASRR